MFDPGTASTNEARRLNGFFTVFVESVRDEFCPREIFLPRPDDQTTSRIFEVLIIYVTKRLLFQSLSVGEYCVTVERVLLFSRAFLMATRISEVQNEKTLYPKMALDCDLVLDPVLKGGPKLSTAFDRTNKFETRDWLMEILMRLPSSPPRPMDALVDHFKSAFCIFDISMCCQMNLYEGDGGEYAIGRERSSWRACISNSLKRIRQRVGKITEPAQLVGLENNFFDQSVLLRTFRARRPKEAALNLA